jgi:hypothetical protein
MFPASLRIVIIEVRSAHSCIGRFGMKRVLFCLLAVALLAPAAYAAPVAYVLPTPGVV